VTRPDLEEERSFLLRSLEDLDREHEAGDLSDEDHALLRDRYVARAASVLRTMEEPEPTAVPHREDRSRPVAQRVRSLPRRRLVVVVGLVVLVLGAVVWFVTQRTGERLPGETLTGSVALSSAQQTSRTLAQAETLERQGNVVEALRLYASVLRAHPDQEEALAEAGWLEYEAGAQARNATLLSDGEGQEKKAVAVDRAAYAPHLYLGSMLLAQGDATGAVAQYRLFLADHPPVSTVKTAAPFITEAFTRADQPAPALPVGSPSG
jgi:tetratricopeptide (TPR) repeat protein